MRTVFDFSPYRRSTVGFDRLFDTLENLAQVDASGSNYPPYDIERISEDSYRITLAVAGFAEHDIDLTAQQNLLIITGRKDNSDEAEAGTWLHRGIATRGFERRFQLADHVEVRAAKLSNGLLSVDLVRDVPEAMKPRKIAIASNDMPQIAEAGTPAKKAA
jgi:molecular chaperone IbpA